MYIHMVPQKTMFRKTETLVILKEIPNDFHESTWIVSRIYMNCFYCYTGMSIISQTQFREELSIILSREIALLLEELRKT